MIGSLIPATDVIFPKRYQEKNTSEVLRLLVENGMLEKSNLTQTAIDEFLTDPNARLTWGRLLYPRFYASSNGEPSLEYPYLRLDYRRLAFTVIGPVSARGEGVILPRENAVRGLHGQDVVVLGCKNGNFLDAVAVFILSDRQEIYIRPSGLILKCPLPNPSFAP
jgi:hypothetical protein